MSYEYRVVWRREHDKTKRTRLYQTLKGAEGFAGFIEEPITDDYLEGWQFDQLSELGDVTEIRIERREVGTWENQ
jgi:hypothetical protein